ncbi:hypothetical protein [Maribacter forsetii]|uniref:hypothetical protein n=1 Tax=Maribacter forsetii TaxID=444515 RepID=UPI000562F5B4|nr:hypothetical protein [Maribacter forsetii]
MKVKVFTIFCAILLTIGCSKNDDTVEETQVEKPEEQELPNEPTSVTVLTGKFIDGAVQGLTFETATQEGVTNADGEFNYVEGEEITFKVGEVILGSVVAKEEITPIDIAQVTDPSANLESPISKNIAAFLQTLDDDQDHANGINLTADVIAAVDLQSIDFSSSVSSTLADIVINVSQQTGAYLEIVYPEIAAANMATALELEYTPQENLALSHLLPFFESYYAADVPSSAVYKNSFNTDGILISTQVIYRYSGRVSMEFNFSGFNENGLPSQFSRSAISPVLLGGSFNSPVNTQISEFSLSYNSSNQVERIVYENSLNDGEQYILVSEWSEENRPILYQDIYVEDIDAYKVTTTILNAFNEGKLISRTRGVITESNDAENGYYSNTELEVAKTYNYNDAGNFSEISTNGSYSSSWQLEGGDVNEFNSSTDELLVVKYRDNNTLEEMTITGNRINNDDSLFTSASEYIFDENEFLIKLSYTDSFEQLREYTYQAGVLTRVIEYNYGLLNYDTTYALDGSYVQTGFEYDDNSEISFSYANSWALNSMGTYVVNKTEYFDEDGILTSYLIYEFYDNGVRKKTKSYDPFNELNWIDYYDENGYWIKAEYFYLGAVDYTYLYENDENGNRLSSEGYDANGTLSVAYYYNDLGYVSYEEYYVQGVLEEYYNYNYENNILITVDGYLANGQLYLIEYYEDGIYVRSEFFDEDGNLTNTSTGKSFSVQANRRLASLKLDAAKRLHVIYESKSVKRIIKSKYALKDKRMLEQY